MRTQEVTVCGYSVGLSNYEYRVLQHLMLQAGDVVSKAALAQRLYGEDEEPEYNAIDTLIARLRRKLDPEGILTPIATVRGSGYRVVLARRGGEGVICLEATAYLTGESSNHDGHRLGRFTASVDRAAGE